MEINIIPDIYLYINIIYINQLGLLSSAYRCFSPHHFYRSAWTFFQWCASSR